MRARLYNNGAEIQANSFVERFVGAVCAAIAGSLKAPHAEKSIAIDLFGDYVAFQIDSAPVALDKNQGFAGKIIRETIRGMVRSLKGIEPGSVLRIVVEIGTLPESRGEQARGNEPQP